VSGRVVVIGSVNIDLVVRAPRLPTMGETVTGGTFERHHGGKGGNQAVATARLGRTTLFVGSVGGDSFGADARAALAGERIDVSALSVVEETPTGVAIIIVGEGGENMIAVAPGANATVDPLTIGQALERLGPLDGDVVLVSHEIPTMAVRAALTLAAEAGATTILNPAPAVGLSYDTVSQASIVTPNRSELGTLLGDQGAVAEPVEAARQLFEKLEPTGRLEAVVVTLGAAGALVTSRRGFGVGDWPVPAPQVKAIDTTGAGDAFNGALAAALAEGRSLEEAATRAVAAGALATTLVGAREGMPTAAALERFLADRARASKPRSFG
jgi:ribokinase